MKKINIVVLLAIASLFLNSCEKEEETNFVQKNYLVGKWVATEIGSLNSDGDLNYEAYENSTDCEADNLIINENKSFQINDYEYLNAICDNFNTEGTYTVENNRITLNYTDSEGIIIEETRNVSSLTFTEMQLSYTDNQTNEIVFLKFQRVM